MREDLFIHMTTRRGVRGKCQSKFSERGQSWVNRFRHLFNSAILAHIKKKKILFLTTKNRVNKFQSRVPQ